jgi:hypothetical protein
MDTHSRMSRTSARNRASAMAADEAESSAATLSRVTDTVDESSTMSLLQMTSLVVGPQPGQSTATPHTPSTSIDALPSLLVKTTTSTLSIPSSSGVSSNVFAGSASPPTGTPQQEASRNSLQLRLGISIVGAFIVLSFLLFLVPRCLKGKRDHKKNRISAGLESAMDFEGKHQRSDWVHFDAVQERHFDVPAVAVVAPTFKGPIEMRNHSAL